MLSDGHQPIIIGSTEYVTIAGIKNIPAKIDTGADTSAIWASDIKMLDDGTLSFKLFGPESPLYTDECLFATDYTVKSVRSSHGDSQIRYGVKFQLTLGNKNFQTIFTLADRSQNHFPVLIGRRALRRNFIVDVSGSSVERPKSSNTARLSQELKSNPHKFHQKYIERSK